MFPKPHPGPQLVDEEPVWRLLLQHAWQPLDQQVICALLCCSRAFESVIHNCCQGRLAVRLNVAKENREGARKESLKQLSDAKELQLARWLSRHHVVVSELFLDSCPSGLRTAGNRQRQLQSPGTSGLGLRVLQQQLAWLLQLVTPAAAPPFPAALVHVARSLTRFELQISSSFRPHPFVKALALLQNLRGLSLQCIDSGTWCADLSDWAPALQHLTALTFLQLQHVSTSKASTQQLPPSLLHLVLGRPLPRLYEHGIREQQLQLQHLTKLQTLQLHTLKGCDMLPNGLRVLEVELCSPLPLLPLQHLQCLTIRLDAPESVLTQLCNMVQLEELHLNYSSAWSLSPRGCTTLQQLPLKALACTLAADQLHCLGTWVQLTSLRLQVEGACCSSSVQHQLAQELAQLTALRSLTLGSVHQQQQGVAAAVADGAAPRAAAAGPGVGAALAAALVGLPALNSLQFEGLGLSQAAAAQLSAATHLTRLQLSSCCGCEAAFLAAAAATCEPFTSSKPATVSRRCVSILVESE